MINTINIKSVKGMTGKIDLGEITHISGDNGSGKTTVVDALKLAVLGYHPDVGKQPGRIIALASDNEMSVETSGSLAVRRAWSQKGGKVSSTTEPKDFEVDTQTALVLDPMDYFGKTDGQRLELINSLFGSKDYDVPEFIGKLASDGNEHGKHIIGEIPADVLSSPPQTALDKLGSWISDLLKVCRRNIKSYKATVETLTDMRVIDEQLQTHGSEESIKSKMNEIEEKGREAGQKLAVLRNQQKAADNSEARKLHLESEIEEHSEIESEIAETKKLLKDLGPEQKPDEDIAKKIRDFSMISIRADAQIMQLTDRLSELRGDRNELKKDGACCPTCGSDRKGWLKDAVFLIEEKIEWLEKEIARYKKQVQESDTKELEKQKAEDSKRVLEHNAKIRQAEKLLSSQEQTLAKISQMKNELINLISTERPDEQEFQDLNNKVSDLKTKYTEYKLKLDAVNKLKNDRQRTEDALKLLEVEEGKMEWLKKAEDTIADEKRLSVERAYAPVLDIANRFLENVFDWKLCYQSGFIGKRKGDLFIDYRTFSGSEKSIVFMAVLVAIASGSPHKIGILDEFGNFDQKRKPKVIDNIRKLIKEGVLTQAIIIEPEAMTGEGITSIRF